MKNRYIFFKFYYNFFVENSG